MSNLDERNSSAGSSSETSSGSSSSGSTSSTCSESGSSSSDSESSASDTKPPKMQKPPPKQAPDNEPKKKEEIKQGKTPKSKLKPVTEAKQPESAITSAPRQRGPAKKKNAASVLAKKKPAVKSEDKSATASKQASKQTAVKIENAPKNKSIFSPEHTSESEQESKIKPKPKKNTKKTNTEINKGEPSQVVQNDPPPNQADNSQTKTVNTDCKSKENPKKKANKAKEAAKPAAKKMPEKEIPSTSAEPALTTEPESEVTQNKDSAKTKPQKPEPQKSGGSSEAVGGAVPRTVTRSVTTRMAKLVQSDSDSHSDAESKAPEKRENKRVPRARASLVKSPVVLSPSTPSERMCPVRGCDSTGHLGGVATKHFSYDTCPVYHNVTGPWCVEAAAERVKSAAAAAKKAIANKNRQRSAPSLEQRAYQIRIKDMRSKWKGNRDQKSKKNIDRGEEREPLLDGFTPELDLRLFRAAQCLAAVKKEVELDDIPTDTGARYVVMGKYMMEVLYQSPYPGVAGRVPLLHVCEFCLKPLACETGAKRHRAKCVWRHPPGDEIYRKEVLSVWEVDGRKQKQYCQQLCLLAKFFLDHKTLYYDVEPFLFYLMTTADEEGCHIIGYFSKEKNSFQNYNVSCILTLPPYQRQGLGRLLIDFSYLLTRVEGKVGSPETPLSDLGLISYRSYWRDVILNKLCGMPGPTLNIRELSKSLGIACSDIISTLQERGLMKYWKGKHIVLVKEEILKEASHRITASRSVDPSCLRWAGPPAPR